MLQKLLDCGMNKFVTYDRNIIFNVCIKHINKVLQYYKTYNVEEDHYFVTFGIKYMVNM